MIYDNHQCLISYQVHGVGIPIIIIPGWNTTKDLYLNLVNNLSNAYQVYLIDLPPFGKSVTNIPLTINDYATVLTEFINHLNLKELIIIAHSFGARITPYLKLEAKVLKTIFIAPAGIKIHPLKTSLKQLNYKLNKRIIKLFSKQKYIKYVNKHCSKDYLSANDLEKKIMQYALKKDSRKSLKKYTIPSLIIYGLNDTQISLKQIKIFNHALKNSLLKTYPNLGHFPHFNEEVIKDIINYLGEEDD